MIDYRKDISLLAIEIAKQEARADRAMGRYEATGSASADRTRYSAELIARVLQAKVSKLEEEIERGK